MGSQSHSIGCEGEPFRIRLLSVVRLQRLDFFLYSGGTIVWGVREQALQVMAGIDHIA